MERILGTAKVEEKISVASNMDFAESVRAMGAFTIHTDAGKVAQIIIRRIEETLDFEYYVDAIEFSDFGSLDKQQKMELKIIIESHPNKLSVKQNYSDGREFWTISWAKQ